MLSVANERTTVLQQESSLRIRVKRLEEVDALLVGVQEDVIRCMPHASHRNRTRRASPAQVIVHFMYDDLDVPSETKRPRQRNRRSQMLGFCRQREKHVRVKLHHNLVITTHPLC